LSVAKGFPSVSLQKPAERIINVYEAWGKPEQAAEWGLRRDEGAKSIEKRLCR
jgi:hypothetical protein